MKYTNPIILCDYSDPDVCRVGNDFYLTASSFNFVPGLPVLHSRDLVHWELINYACKSIPLPGYEKVQNAKGIWAPSIRFHGGYFYIFVATPDEGIFFTRASDPYGEWSELECIWAGKGFEDPCPIWDDDGKVWLVHAYVKSRIGFNSKLGLLELDPVSLKAISEDKIIFDGTKTQPTIEGPKFYKRNGFYYIFAPAGGVTTGWQTVLRSKRIDGDYEEKIVLAQGQSRINGPHQGGWVDTASGEDWFVHFQDAGIFGRIVHMQPMRWVDDWPVMGNAVALEGENALSVVGEPVESWNFPRIEKTAPASSGKTAREFQYSANYGEKSFATTEKSLWLTPSVCTKKIDSKEFLYEKEIPLDGEWHENQRKGIIFLGNEYAALQLTKISENEFSVSYIESTGSEEGDAERKEVTKWSETVVADDAVKISVTLKLEFHAALDGKHGIVQFSVEHQGKTGKVSFKSQPFTTTNAHWVGGRYGWF